MDFVKISALIVREKIKLLKNKVQARFLLLPDNLKEKKISKMQRQERNQEIQSQEENQQIYIQMEINQIRTTDKST